MPCCLTRRLWCVRDASPFAGVDRERYGQLSADTAHRAPGKNFPGLEQGKGQGDRRGVEEERPPERSLWSITR